MYLEWCIYNGNLNIDSTRWPIGYQKFQATEHAIVFPVSLLNSQQLGTLEEMSPVFGLEDFCKDQFSSGKGF